MKRVVLWALRTAGAVLLGTCVAACAQKPTAPAAPNAATTSATSSIGGVVKDVNGVVVPGAHVLLTSSVSPAIRDCETDASGRFSFANVPAGNFELTFSEEGLETKVVPGTVHAGDDVNTLDVALRIATAKTSVDVTMTQHELAEVDVKLEVNQNILGFIPNYFVVYHWDAQPLDARQKFELANRTIIYPINIPVIAANAGVEQALNSYPGYHQGAQGYARRFGASYADFAIGTELGGAILPVVFKEDPRYFYKGTGTVMSRLLYAASTSVVGRTDKGKRRISFSSILGDFGAGAISNLYYPAGSRSGATLTLENGALGLGFDSVGNIIQEFLIRRLTPKLPPAESK